MWLIIHAGFKVIKGVRVPVCCIYMQETGDWYIIWKTKENEQKSRDTGADMLYLYAWDRGPMYFMENKPKQTKTSKILRNQISRNLVHSWLSIQRSEYFGSCAYSNVACTSVYSIFRIASLDSGHRMLAPMLMTILVQLSGSKPRCRYHFICNVVLQLQYISGSMNIRDLSYAYPQVSLYWQWDKHMIICVHNNHHQDVVL